MYIPSRFSRRPVSRRVLVFSLVAAAALAVASLLAYNGIAPFRARNADELAGVAVGLVVMVIIQRWANGFKQ